MPNTDYTPYTKTTWQDGDQITTDKMTNIENGIEALSTQVEEVLGNTYGSLNDRMTNGLINTDGDVLLKGDLRIQKAHPSLYFLEEESASPLGGLYQVNDSQGNNRIVLYQRVPDSEIEAFFLPVPSEHTIQTNYSILTSKNPVTIACGGTGATTAEEARANLGIASLIDNDGAASVVWLAAADTYVKASPRIIEFYRRGNIVLFRTNISLLATATDTVVMGTIPEGFRPKMTIYNSGMVQGTVNNVTPNTFYLGFLANGGVQIAHWGNPATTGFIRITGCYTL